MVLESCINRVKEIVPVVTAQYDLRAISTTEKSDIHNLFIKHQKLQSALGLGLKVSAYVQNREASKPDSLVLEIYERLYQADTNNPEARVFSAVRLVVSTIDELFDEGTSPESLSISILSFSQGFNLEELSFFRRLKFKFPEIVRVQKEDQRYTVSLMDDNRKKDVAKLVNSFTERKNKKFGNAEVVKSKEFSFFNYENYHLSSIAKLVINRLDSRLSELSTITVLDNSVCLALRNPNLANKKDSKTRAWLSQFKDFNFSLESSITFTDIACVASASFNNVLEIKVALIDNKIRFRLFVDKHPDAQNSKLGEALLPGYCAMDYIVYENNLSPDIFEILPIDFEFSEISYGSKSLFIKTNEDSSRFEIIRKKIKENTNLDVYFGKEALQEVRESEEVIDLRSKIPSGLELVKIEENKVTEKLHLTFINEPSKAELSNLEDLLDKPLSHSFRTKKILNVPNEIEKIIKTLRSAKEVFIKKESVNQELNLTGLGACERIGNSAFLINIDGLSILLDYGSDFSGSYINLLPEDKFKNLDAIILTHAHHDHSGKIPELTKLYPHIKIYATKATLLLALYTMTQGLVHGKKSCSTRFSREDIFNLYKNAVIIQEDTSYNLTKSVKLEVFQSGHLTGSIGLVLRNADSSLLYTGDMLMTPTTILPGVKFCKKADIVICESTNGMEDLESRSAIINKLNNKVKFTLYKNAFALAPVLTLGRFIDTLVEVYRLEDEEKFFSDNNFKIYVVGYLSKMLNIYRYLLDLYPNIFNQDEIEFVKRVLNPESDIIVNLNTKEAKARVKSANQNVERGVVLASPGMLSGGNSKEFFEAFSHDPNNSLLILSYQAEGTFGNRIMNYLKSGIDDYDEFFGFLMDVVECRLTAHSDYKEIESFIREVSPKILRLVHGSDEKIDGLKRFLRGVFEDMSIKALKEGEQLEIINQS